MILPTNFDSGAGYDLRVQHSPNASPRPPVPFIVGMGRSGTTLLRMMLDAHSTLAIPPETYFFRGAESSFEKRGAEGLVEEMIQSPAWPDFGLSASDFEQRVAQRRPAAAAEVLRDFYELYAERQDKHRWGDKTPLYVMHMVEIQRQIPEAHFIHIVRDGRDVALSIMPLWFGDSQVAEVAKRWSRRLSTARRQAPQLSSYKEVRFEDLIREPSSVLKSLCSFLDLDWEVSMLDYHREAAQRLATETPDFRWRNHLVPHEERKKMHEFLGHPPTKERCERWRREMSAVDLEEFESVAEDTLAEFGYASSRPIRSSRPSATT